MNLDPWEARVIDAMMSVNDGRVWVTPRWVQRKTGLSEKAVDRVMRRLVPDPRRVVKKKVLSDRSVVYGLADRVHDMQEMVFALEWATKGLKDAPYWSYDVDGNKVPNVEKGKRLRKIRGLDFVFYEPE